MAKFLLIAILAFSAVLVLSLPYGERDSRPQEGFGSSNQDGRGFRGGHQGTPENSTPLYIHGNVQGGRYGGDQIGTKGIFTEHGGHRGMGGYQNHGY